MKLFPYKISIHCQENKIINDWNDHWNENELLTETGSYISVLGSSRCPVAAVDIPERLLTDVFSESIETEKLFSVLHSRSNSCWKHQMGSVLPLGSSDTSHHFSQQVYFYEDNIRRLNTLFPQLTNVQVTEGPVLVRVSVVVIGLALGNCFVLWKRRKTLTSERLHKYLISYEAHTIYQIQTVVIWKRENSTWAHILPAVGLPVYSSNLCPLQTHVVKKY